MNNQVDLQGDEKDNLLSNNREEPNVLNHPEPTSAKEVNIELVNLPAHENEQQ